MPISDYRLFLAEFRRTFRTTGAVLPSGRALARALARSVRETGPGRRILEVGPGTGAVTAQIVSAMNGEDGLDLVELNDRFVARLRQRFDEEAVFRQVADRCRVLHENVENLASEEPYDIVISGLPLNNFAADEVERILNALIALVRPGGTLSFFEYIAVRRAKALLGGKADRARLAGIGAAIDQALKSYSERRQWIWANVPPAWVHHLRAPTATATH